MLEEIDRFLQYLMVEEEASENTVSAYRNDLNQLHHFLATYRTPLGKSVSEWSDVDKVAVQDFILELRSRDYATTTVARKIAAVKSFFEFLRQSGAVPADPTAGLESPKVKKHLPHTIPPDEVEKLRAAPALYDSPQALRDLALMETLYATGVRVTELVNLNLADVDFERKYLYTGKGNRRTRIVPIEPRTIDALRRYLQDGRPHLVVDKREIALFLNHRGQRLTRQGLWLIIKRYVKEAGIQGTVTPHTLRHSFALHLLNSGAGLREVKERLGHASLSTTQVYRQASNESPNEITIDGKPAPKKQ